MSKNCWKMKRKTRERRKQCEEVNFVSRGQLDKLELHVWCPDIPELMAAC